MRLLLLLVVAVAPGCTRATPSSAKAAPAPDGSSLRPATLVYAGLHQGDHPPWKYRQTVTLVEATRAGQPVWRRTSTFGDDQRVSSAVEVDRRTLQAVRSDLLWNGATVRLTYSPGRTTGVIEQDGAARNVAYRHQEPIVVAETLDLYVAALPLAPGFETRVSLLDTWLLDQPPRYVTRPFTIRVKAEEVVTVPAGALPVFVVAIDPTDGDERQRSTYHVLRSRPHYAVRMEYVVNPATVGEEKRSVGVDELVALSLPPRGPATD